MGSSGSYVNLDIRAILVLPCHHHTFTFRRGRRWLYNRRQSLDRLFFPLLHLVRYRYVGSPMALPNRDQLPAYENQGCSCVHCDQLVRDIPLPLPNEKADSYLRITNFVIVEITPIGIQNLGWKFWIVWTVFNAVFLPIIYYLYPETSNRSLEDLDEYYRSDPSLIVIGDKDATSHRRPTKYIEREKEGIDANLVAAKTVNAKSDGSAEHIE